MPDDFKLFIGASLRAVEKKDYSWFFTFGDWLVIATESLWRVVTPEGITVTSEDHQQKFGLPAPVDAAERVLSRLASFPVQSVSVEPKTGDLFVSFDEGLYLQFLQESSGYESWRATTKQGDSICTGGGKIAFFPAVRKR